MTFILTISNEIVANKNRKPCTGLECGLERALERLDIIHDVSFHIKQ